MIRFSFLLFLTTLLVVEGFEVAKPPATFSSMMVQQQHSSKICKTTMMMSEIPTPENVDDDETEPAAFFMMDEEELMIDETDDIDEVPVSKGLSVDVDSKLKELSEKAKEFASDEQVQVAMKATTEFAKSVASGILTIVGDKLKDLKKQKEEMKEMEEEITMTKTTIVADEQDLFHP